MLERLNLEILLLELITHLAWPGRVRARGTSGDSVKSAGTPTLFAGCGENPSDDKCCKADPDKGFASNASFKS